MKKLYIFILFVFSLTVLTVFAETKEIVVDGYKGDIELAIEVKNKKILNIKVLNHNEPARIGGEALEKMIPVIIKKQTYNVDSVVGATVTSEALKQAVKEAIE